MRIPFFSKTPEPPEFYKNYAAQFSGKSLPEFEQARFIVFDTETTGTNAREDRMLSIGALELKGNTISLSSSFELYVEQDVFNEEAVAIKKDNKKVVVSIMVHNSHKRQ